MKIRNILILGLLVIIAVLAMVQAKGGQKNKKKPLSPLEKKLKVLKEEYRNTKCSYLLEDTILNQCLHFYVNRECFAQAYGEMGLEIGEVNAFKDKDFEECYKKKMDQTK